MIEVKDLVKTYEGRVPTLAVRGVTLDVSDGEFVAVMGRSGSGKSTFLHQLGLLDRPTSGSIRIGGKDVLALSETQRTRYRLENLGYVFQAYALVAELTAFENVHLPAMALGEKSDAEQRAKVTELMKTVGLADRMDHYPHEMSGGQQQRVAIARSLVNEPEILFADEPSANLDSTAARTVMELFRKLNRETGQTIVMVTHEPDDRQYVDRVIWLDDGKIDKEERMRGNEKKGR